MSVSLSRRLALLLAVSFTSFLALTCAKSETDHHGCTPDTSNRAPIICIGDDLKPDRAEVHTLDVEPDANNQPSANKVKITWRASGKVPFKVTFKDNAKDCFVEKNVATCNGTNTQCTATVNVRVPKGSQRTCSVSIVGKSDPDQDIVINPCC